MYRYGKTVGEFTRRYRAEHSLTQWDLANKLKCHAQYVSNVERGINTGAIQFVKKFSRIIKDHNARSHLLHLVADEKMESLLESIDD
jgi:ribosome-binding protein aMBF1 (putative translation factor)